VIQRVRIGCHESRTPFVFFDEPASAGFHRDETRSRNMQSSLISIDVAVVGGGLAGLTAAAFAARAGAVVHVLDARQQVGGRAQTAVRNGFHLNQGPHALVRASDGAGALRELGIVPAGGRPPLRSSRLSLDGRVRRLPPPRSLSQLSGFLRRLRADRRDPGLVQVSAQEWIEGRLSDPVARSVAAAAVRVSSYCGDLSTFSADAAAMQLHGALRGVVYLDRGWSQLVNALDVVARSRGATVHTGAKVSSIDVDGGRYVIGVDGGRRLVARSVVIAAGGPAVATHLVGGRSDSLAATADAAIPVHGACLDVGVRQLTTSSRRFVLGVDRSTYASVHTPSARLAEQGHVMHLMHYEPRDGVDVEDLEALADELQPGWREHEMVRQIGRRRVVAFDRPQPGTGLPGRPAAAVDDLPGVFVAGDWVGSTDLLGTAAIASGRAAGLAAGRHCESGRMSRSVAPV
jgi:phytoene dehydrogenase-like protein